MLEKSLDHFLLISHSGVIANNKLNESDTHPGEVGRLIVEVQVVDLFHEHFWALVEKNISGRDLEHGIDSRLGVEPWLFNFKESHFTTNGEEVKHEVLSIEAP